MRILDLANAIGWDGGNLSRLEREQQGINTAKDWDKLERMAAALGVPLVSLFVDDAAVEPREGMGRVPVLAWEKLKVLAHKTPNGPIVRELAGAEPEYVDLYFVRPHEGMFATRLRGASMVAPPGAAHSFPDGTVVVIDPAADLLPGRFVLALHPSTGEPTFKKLEVDAGQRFLVPLNPAFPSVELPDGAPILGVGVEWRIGGAL